MLLLLYLVVGMGVAHVGRVGLDVGEAGVAELAVGVGRRGQVSNVVLRAGRCCGWRWIDRSVEMRRLAVLHGVYQRPGHAWAHHVWRCWLRVLVLKDHALEERKREKNVSLFI